MDTATPSIPTPDRIPSWGTLYSEEYVRFILSLAPWVVILALSLERAHLSRWKRWAYPSVALLFSLTVFHPYLPVLRVWGVLPWLAVISFEALNELREFSPSQERETHHWALLAALLYLPVGGIWALFDQLSFQPLGFSGIIVLLTGVHFHYAGFALPRLTGLWLKHSPESRFVRLAAWGIIFGVPLVAIGITSTQLKLPLWIETFAVSVLASSAFVTSLAQFRWSLTLDAPWYVRILFTLGGVSLAAGMILATIYGWRHVYQVAWATIPAMYAIHGTLNSLGFCVPGFLAWRLWKGAAGSSVWRENQPE